MPETPCENYLEQGEFCFDSENQLCLSWSAILMALLVSNFLQFVFEGGMLHSLDVTFKPTSLDRMQDPEKYKDEIGGSEGNPD